MSTPYRDTLMMQSTSFHVEDRLAAPELCMRLTLDGWSVCWTDDTAGTHLRIQHDPRDLTELHQAVLELDPAARVCLGD